MVVVTLVDGDIPDSMGNYTNTRLTVEGREQESQRCAYSTFVYWLIVHTIFMLFASKLPADVNLASTTRRSQKAGLGR